MHLGIDTDTLKIRAIEITGSRVGDAPMLPDLLDQIPADQPIGKVSADGAYDTRACQAAIAARSTCIVILARKNTRPWLENTPGAQARHDTVRATCRLGRTIWRRWSGYHRRSLVATKMSSFKLLGERVMARDFDRQEAELQIRAAVLNCFTAADHLKLSAWCDSVHRKGNLGLSQIYATAPLRNCPPTVTKSQDSSATPA